LKTSKVYAIVSTLNVIVDKPHLNQYWQLTDTSICAGECNCGSLHSNNVEVENFNKHTSTNKKRTHIPSKNPNYILYLQIIKDLRNHPKMISHL
jgi:hypothetical protein